MKIRLAVIPPEELVHVRPVVDSLLSAFNSGDMACVDAATGKLLKMTRLKQSINLTEKEWKEWLAEVRTTNPAFLSDYLVSGEFCTKYFPDATPETIVLQFTFDGWEESYV